MVAGPPVDVQVRVLDWSSKVKLITLGEPAWIELKATRLLLMYDAVASKSTCTVICLCTLCSGRKSTSGGAGEGPGLLIKSYTVGEPAV